MVPRYLNALRNELDSSCPVLSCPLHRVINIQQDTVQALSRKNKLAHRNVSGVKNMEWIVEKNSRYLPTYLLTCRSKRLTLVFHRYGQSEDTKILPIMPPLYCTQGILCLLNCDTSTPSSPMNFLISKS